MGKRGPKPTPTAILKLRGSIIAPRRSDRELKAELPEPPAVVEGRSLEVWNEIAPMLYSLGVITKRDRFALARYCITYAEWEAAVDIGRKYGPTITVKDKAGNPVGLKMNPQIRDARTLAMLLMKLEAEFGMTPASRAGVGQVQDNKNDDSLQEMLKRG